MTVHLMHAGEEIIFVLLPVAIIYWLVAIDRKRRERKLRQLLEVQKARLLPASRTAKGE